MSEGGSKSGSSDVHMVGAGRAASMPAAVPMLQVDRLRIDLDRREVLLDAGEVRLTPTVWGSPGVGYRLREAAPEPEPGGAVRSRP